MEYAVLIFLRSVVSHIYIINLKGTKHNKQKHVSTG